MLLMMLLLMLMFLLLLILLLILLKHFGAADVVDADAAVNVMVMVWEGSMECMECTLKVAW